MLVLSNMASQWSVEKELDDMTECCICKEIFSDPRILPCIHTFCLNCLLTYGEDRQPGDRMPCPLCRTEFTVPDDGLSGTQKNFFMTKLLHVRQKAQRLLCNICSSGDDSADKVARKAATYCTQCQQRYCSQCSLHHSRVKSTSKHVQVVVGSPESNELASKVDASECDQHSGEELKLFCQDCKIAICVMCAVTTHRAHDCLDIENVAREVRKRVASDTGSVAECLRKSQGVVCLIEKKKTNFVRRIADVEAEINAAADKLIAAVQLDRAKLLSEVESIRQKGVGQLETVQQDVTQHVTMLNSFKVYSETLLSSGTACDLTASANSLHDRAGELSMFDVIGHVNRFPHHVNVHFSSSTLLDSYHRNRVGSITEEGWFLA